MSGSLALPPLSFRVATSRVVGIGLCKVSNIRNPPKSTYYGEIKVAALVSMVQDIPLLLMIH